MKRVHCTQCGANLEKDENGDFYCKYCGSVFKSKQSKGKIFIKDSYFKFNKDDEVKDVEEKSKYAPIEFSKKHIKKRVPAFIISFIVIIYVISILTSLFGNSPYYESPQNITYIAGTNGTITVDGQSVNQYDCLLEYEDSVTVTAVPNFGYKFSRWSDNNTNYTRTDYHTGTQSITYTAYFTKIPNSTVKYIASKGGTISGNTYQSIPWRGSGTSVTAVANTGYKFSGWSDGYKNATRSETLVTTNLEFTAYFTKTFSGGDGTETNPYLISSVDDYLYFINNHSKAFYKITANLDFKNVSSFDMKTISSFSGTLDGGNHTITNLSCSMFNTLSSAEIKNVIFKGFSLQNLINKKSYRGILANEVKETIKITNCKIDDCNLDVSCDSNGDAGLFVGVIRSNSNVTFDGCEIISSLVMTVASQSYTNICSGGLIGFVETSCTVSITDCNVDMTGSMSSLNSWVYSGGLIGYVKQSCNITIKNCTVDAFMRPIVVQLNYHVAGLIGYSSTSSTGITLENNEIIYSVSDSGTGNRISSETVNFS